MGVLILLIALILIIFIFGYAAKIFLRHYRKLYQEGQKRDIKWYSQLRLSLSIIIAGFYFNAMMALIGIGYVVVRWLSNT